MRPAEISEFLFAIKSNGVPINVIMDMGFIRMSANIESVFSFEKARGEVISDLVCFFRCHFSRLKGLTDLINEHVVLLLLARKVLVLPFRK